ncbi:MAG: 16S rRNA (cytosine(967)-C(5))-methyltransferase RsmB [Burkholderiaceae bacterium]|jgi:16S rRNA (cytosine967-C5)-methyltransferase|nr:16S rRNA (cytosine(967)-C(5))-methyltransferase RsmB [Burkholderiaceae bacterium]
MQPALWQQLDQAAAGIGQMRAGRSLTAWLPTVAPRLRPGVQALSFHVARHLGQALALRRLLAQRHLQEPVDALLCTTLALLAGEPAMYPAFTVVDQAVEAARRNPRTRAAAGLLNACLRRYLRERAALDAAVQGDPQAQWNHPVWWIEMLRRDHPEHWQLPLRAAGQHAPLVLRVNRQRASVPQVLARFEAAGLPAARLGGDAVELLAPQPVQAIPGFAEGHVSVQSAAAQRAAPLLLAGLKTPAPRVLDACAAPGGKTAHLLEINPAAQVTALDSDAARMVRVRENLARLGLQAHCVVADATAPAGWWDARAFDAILLDAPCSASGIVCRHPDIRWLRRENDIVQLAARQDALLAALWPLVKPGGRLLYCTCSVFRAEGAQRADSFLRRNSDAALLPSPGHLLPALWPRGEPVGDNDAYDDGFFFALLEKIPSFPSPS